MLQATFVNHSMAIIIPNLSTGSLGYVKATRGEQRFALRLESLLDNDWLCFYDVPVGKRRRYPDFIVVHPRSGLLFLEVKDWKLSSINSIDYQRVELRTANGLQTKVNPLEQARQGAQQTIDMLRCDPNLQEKQGKYKGSLICPYGYGVVLTNITRKQVQSVVDDVSERVLPGSLLICQDEMQDKTDPAAFQKRLCGMFPYTFDRALTLPDLNRIRWHLYPEIRIGNLELFPQQKAPVRVSVPDIVKVMDIHQEQLARGLGDGHRVIHGVAGSGKTLILGYRSKVLAELLNKPILVLCFNITLAAKLRSDMSSKGITDKVHVYHFHDWCGEQLRTYQVDVAEGDKPYWERQVEFGQRDIPFQLLYTSARKKRYNPQGNQVVLLTRQSSKGLEFSRVILVGLGKLRAEPKNVAEESRLLYVAMTRARKCLLVTASEANVYTQKIEAFTAART